MSKPSSSLAIPNPLIFDKLNPFQPENESFKQRKDNQFKEEELRMELLDSSIPHNSYSVTQPPAGQVVIELLNSNRYTEEVYGDYVPKRQEYLSDRDFDKPQVTRESLLQDGRDIVKYLELNRYAEDMNTKLDQYDVNCIIEEFQQSLDDAAQLEKAVDRLKLLKSQLSSKL
jgi:hypothetical protein